MRRCRVASLLTILAGAATPACTLVAEFVDAPLDACDAGSCPDATVDATVDASDAALDAADARDAWDVFDAGAPDVSLLCKGRAGWYCGFNGLNGTAPSKDDLVECRDGGIKTFIECDAGCLVYPTGVPDRCNECPTKKDGYYCGNEFPSALPGTETVVVLCTKGVAMVEKSCSPSVCVDDAGGKGACK